MPIGALGYVGTVPVDKGAVRNFIEKQYSIAARGTAGTDAETVLDKMLKGSGAAADPIQIDSVEVIAQAAIAANGSNYVTFKLYNRKGDGTGTDVLASLTTASVSQAAYVPFTLTLDATKAPPKLNDVLTFSVEHSAGGVATPQMAVRIRIRA
jgi:hypothetical protein